MTPNAARLAYWYFRLNGFLTTESFVLHPDEGANQRTEADLLAVRFPNRAELVGGHPLRDDPRVADCESWGNVVIAEVTAATCKLNGPWTAREAGNIRRVLGAIGCVPESALNIAAEALYTTGRWSNSIVTIRLFALGEQRARLRIPDKQQIEWSEVIDFCVERFRDCDQFKASIGQWESDGRELRKLSVGTSPSASIREYFRLRSANVMES